MNIKKYPIGLVIGRFQPFHNGHAYLIKKALSVADKLIIGIGSSNVKNNDNPLNYDLRKKMVEMFLEKEDLKDKIIKIVAIPDIPDDDEWLQIILKEVGEFDVAIGNNDWVNGIFRNAKTPILEVPYFQRYLYEGQKIRDMMKNGEPWQERVPNYLASYIQSKLLPFYTTSKKRLVSDVNAKFVKIVDDFTSEHQDVLKELAKR